MKQLILLFILFPFFGFAQKPCERDSVYDQFDFWIGEWNVYAKNGKLAGTSKITEILDNCVILEEWISSGTQQGLQFSGKSFNSYNALTKQWQQNWVDNTGGTTEYLIGFFSNNVMQFESRPFLSTNNVLSIRRLSFFKLEKNKVRQLGEISSDEGKTWKVEFDLEYRKK